MLVILRYFDAFRNIAGVNVVTK